MGKRLGSGKKETVLFVRASEDEVTAWATEARRVATEERWDSPDRALSRWVRRVLNAAVKGGAK